MFKRLIVAMAIFMTMLCLSGNDVEAARDPGNGSGRDGGGFHERVWQVFDSDYQVPPTQPQVKPPVTPEPTQPFSQPQPQTTSETYNANDTWLVQWYLCGTDLETTDQSDGGASRDLKEMLAVNLAPNVKVLIQTGGTVQWKSPIQWGNINLQIRNDAVERFLYTSSGIEKVQSLPDANMGDADTLADFIRYGAQIPADHRIFIFWDHGRIGVGGVCLDEHTGDILTLNDLDEAFTKVYSKTPNSKPFEIIAFDTCVTSTYEYANSIHKFSRYMVASEASLPNPGLNYTGWLGALSQNPGMNGRELGVKICDTFLEAIEASDAQSFIGKHEAWESTMSVIDLNAIPSLGKAYEDFGREAISKTQENASSFYTQFGRIAISPNTERYNFYNPIKNSIDTINQVDLLTFAQEIKREGILTKTPDALIEAIRRAVIYNDARGRYYKKGGGIAAYHYYSNAGGSFYSYSEQRPAPEPQKQFYGKLVRSHSDVIENLSQEETAYIPSNSSEQRTNLNNPAAETSTEQQQGFSAWIAKELTPEEKEEFLRECGDIQRNLQERGVLSKSQSLFDLRNPAEQERVWNQMTPEEQLQLIKVYIKIMKKAQESFDIDVKRDGTLTAQFTPEQLQYITSIRFMICQGVEKGKPDIGVEGTGFIYLGTGTDVQINWAENKFIGTFPTKWPTLNGIPVYIQTTAENVEYDKNKNIVGGYNLYIIPIKLNGKECSLEVAYDFTDKCYYILKVTSGIGENGTISRDSIEVKKGDVITPILYGLLLKDDYSAFELKSIDSNKSLVVENRLTIEDTPFADGDYAYLFQFIDLRGDAFNSRAFSVELDEGEIYPIATEDVQNNITQQISVTDDGTITFQLPEDMRDEIKESLE